MVAAPTHKKMRVKAQNIPMAVFAVKAARRAVLDALPSGIKPVASADNRRTNHPSKIAVFLGAAAIGFALQASAEPISVDLPTQPLADSLTQLAKKAGVSVVFDSALVTGKTAPALNGAWEPDEAFRRLLRGSGLQITMEGDTALIRRQASGTKNETIKTDVVNVRASRFKQVGPMPGLNLTREEIPGNVQSISSEEIKESKAMTIAELFNSRLQSINVNDYQGNPFQMDITYRGFTAGPQIGTPQGLSVFFDGVRVNEPFGDVVNWDLLPMNALAGIDVFPGSNPIFGLNTLGGAVALRTKNGFDDAGTDVQVLTGSFGRKQVMLSTGGSKGDIAGFFALNRFEEDGWRDNSPSKVMQVFGKASYRTDNLDLNASVTYAGNDLIGNGLIPIEMYKDEPESVFTSPDKTRNELLQYQISGAFQVNDTFSVTGQVYRRKSDRKAVTGDVNRDFGERGFQSNRYVTRRALPGENPVCAFSSTNAYGIPDYYVAPTIFGGLTMAHLNALDYTAGNTAYDLDGDGDYDIADAIADGSVDPSTLNQAIPASLTDYLNAATTFEQGMFTGENGGGFLSQGDSYLDPTDSDGNGEGDYLYSGVLGDAFMGAWANLLSNQDQPSYFLNPDDGMTYTLLATESLNGSGCGNSGTYANAEYDGGLIYKLDENGSRINRNGAWDTSNAGTGTGSADGTPTAMISSIDIGQIIRGGSLQLNWDSGRHKFMVGTSLDHATNTYTNSQLLGLLNADREAYLAPDEIGMEFAGATYPVRNNDFNGSSDTRSLYFSETFNPVERFHFSASARYNYTRVLTNMRTRNNTEEVTVSQGASAYMSYLLCEGAGLSDCDQFLLNNPVPEPDYVIGGTFHGGAAYFDPWEKEVTTYHKLNPSFGATWSPQDHINWYGGWNQGTRTPSVIELGCAFDDRIVTLTDTQGAHTGKASLINKRACTLPSTLSGDPYLPQVVARTWEFGGRGKLVNGWDWNATIYNTNLQDDIYFVAYTSTKSFFDTIGKTRRRGVEMGLGGTEGKWDFRANYSLTDATFEALAKIANADNSSVNHVNTQDPDWNMMTIKPGDRMPGIPLHNLNLNLGYRVTDKWRIGLTMVAHSWSYARGNENNKHRGGTFQDVVISDGQGGTTTLRRNFNGDGKTPGYAVFNLNTSYEFGNGWIANLTVNNLLGKEYYSASRIDINPFSPSVNGAIGDSGFNYNSNDWQSTTFVAPGAPRAAWLTVKYNFGAAGK